MSGVNPLSIIELTIDSNAALITFNNSEQGNLLNLEFVKTALDLLRSLQQRDDVRVVIFRADGSNFCLGMDLSLAESGQPTKENSRETLDLYVDLLTTIQQIPKPVISLVDGDVKAGGVGLACACDIVLASENATFELGEALFGLIPANVIPFISPLRIEPAKLRYLILTARKLSAQEAFHYNLVDEVFSEDQKEQKTKAVLKNLFRVSPQAVGETKTFISALFENHLQQAIPMAKNKLLELITTPNVQQAISAFRQGSTPVWFNKFKPQNPLWPRGDS